MSKGLQENLKNNMYLNLIWLIHDHISPLSTDSDQYVGKSYHTHTKVVTGVLDSIDKYKKTPALSAVLL